MSSRVVAIIREGAVFAPTGEMITPPRAVAVTEACTSEPPKNDHRREQRVEQMRDPLDEIASMLARTVRLARDLDEGDARRVRNLVQACSAALTATTYLPRDDQRRFERALREQA